MQDDFLTEKKKIWYNLDAILEEIDGAYINGPSKRWWEYHGFNMWKTMKFLLKTRKRLFKFLEHMKKVDLEHLTLRGHIQTKRDREKHCVAYLTCLCKWIAYLRLEMILKREILLRDKKDKTFVNSLVLNCPHAEVTQHIKELKGFWPSINH